MGLKFSVKKVLYFAAEGLGAYKLDNSDLLRLIEDKSSIRDKSSFLRTIMAASAKLPYPDPQLTFSGSKLTIVGSRSHPTKELEDFVKDKRKKYEQVEFISAGSSLKLCLVAEGRADIYPRLGPTMEWDTAAPHAVVRGVGKHMVAYDSGVELVYNKEQLFNPSFLVY